MSGLIFSEKKKQQQQKTKTKQNNKKKTQKKPSLSKHETIKTKFIHLLETFKLT